MENLIIKECSGDRLEYFSRVRETRLEGCVQVPQIRETQLGNNFLET